MPSNQEIDPTIFKAYDIRGIVGESLTEDTVRTIAQAIGSEARARGEDTIYIGRDGRLSGPQLSQALSDGLRKTGCNVIDIGMVPTPLLYYAAYALGTGSGISLTGSHNPPDYNGLKMMLAGDTLSGEAIQSLRRRIEQNQFVSGEGGYNTKDITSEYLRRVVEDINVSRSLKVVIDCGNGVAGAVAPTLLRELGCQVTELFCEVDGTFPNHHPDPSQLENLQDLIAAVKTQQADLGLAFDGDGDRLGVIAPTGEVIWADRQMMLYAEDVLRRNPGGQIIFDIKCTTNLPRVIEQAGGEPIMWKTGHSFIKAKLKETGALLAGEMSGHIFFKERWYGFDDALYTAARLLEILSNDARSVSEVFAALPDTINTPELRLDLEEGKHYALVEQFVAAARFDDAKITTIDGIRVDFEDGFGLARASNTTPCVVFRFEASTEAALKRIQQDFKRQLQGLDASLKLPF